VLDAPDMPVPDPEELREELDSLRARRRGRADAAALGRGRSAAAGSRDLMPTSGLSN
jgi:hypothetical protein